MFNLFFWKFTPENTSYYTLEKNKDFDLENMTEKMENCGNSVLNLAMSMAFTEKPQKNSTLLPFQASVEISKRVKSKYLNKSSSQKNVDSKHFLASFKVEDCSAVKKKLAKLEPILDKYKTPVDHIFREESPDPKKPFYRVFHFIFFILFKIILF